MIREDTLKIFKNPPSLSTERLILRKLKKSDAEDMFSYASNPKVTEFLTWDPHPDLHYTVRYLSYLNQKYRSGEFYDWGIVFQKTGKMIGTCGFTRFDFDNNAAEIGYVVNPEYQNLGIATEAAKAVIRFGFVELNAHRIEARYMEGNLASRRVMDKLGMHYEGMSFDSLYVKERYVNVCVCSCLVPSFL